MALAIRIVTLETFTRTQQTDPHVVVMTTRRLLSLISMREDN